MAEVEKENTKKDKKSKKAIIIILLIIAIIAIIAVVTAVMLNNSDDESDKKSRKSKNMSVEWGDTYYSFLVDELDENENFENVEKITLSFLEMEEDKEPAMILETDTGAKLIYSIDDKNKVVECNNSSLADENKTVSDVQYLYNIEKKESDWYVCSETAESKQYTQLKDYTEVSKYANESEEKASEYLEDHSITIKNDEMVYDEGELKLSKFDDTFIEVEDKDVDIAKTEIKTDSKKSEIFDAVSDLAEDEYKTEQDILTDKLVQQVIESRRKAIEKIKQQIEEYEKEKAEEAKKNQETQSQTPTPAPAPSNNTETQTNNAQVSSEYLTLGGYTIKYGTYIGETPWSGTTLKLEITLNSDLSFSQTTYNGGYPIGIGSGKYHVGGNGIYISEPNPLVAIGNNVLQATTSEGTKYSLIYQGN